MRHPFINPDKWLANSHDPRPVDYHYFIYSLYLYSRSETHNITHRTQTIHDVACMKFKLLYDTTTGCFQVFHVFLRNNILSIRW